MTKPTGRPRGRPKTKEYVTLMARVPQDLAERTQRYASRKRQTISEVLRDGLLVLLQDEDPYRPFMSDKKRRDGILSDMKAEEITPHTQPVMMSDNEAVSPAKVSDTKKAKAGIVYDTKKAAPSIMSDIIADFDAAKYVLGRLCPRGHDYHGAGQSLLRRSNRHCLVCDREKAQERKQAAQRV